MEHFVQFAINIDDTAIQKKLEENAYDDIIQLIKKDFIKYFPKKYRSDYFDEIDWKYLIEDLVKDFIKEHKEEVINAASDKLFNSIRRSKEFKEKIGTILDE